MSTRAPNGDLSLKNINDHAKFNANCAKNTITVALAKDLVCCHTRYKDTPIKMYSNVQTGPKSQLGGLNPGFAKLAYHVGMACEVNTPATTPTAKHNPIEIISRTTII